MIHEENHVNVVELSSFVDNELSKEEHASVEAHVEACVTCRGMLDDLRAVKTWVSSDVATAADRAAPRAWNELRTALPSRNTAEHFGGLARLSIAASLLIGVAMTGMWWKTRHIQAPVLKGNTTSAAALESPALLQLESLAHARLTVLPVSKSQALKSSLDIIDGAIADARSARKADPGNDFVATYLDDLLRRKADALREVVEMADAESTS